MVPRNILVTGGAGYIGSHVTVELIQAGYNVIVADNLSNCDLTCYEGVKKVTGKDDIPFYEIDCCDGKSVRMVFSRHTVDAVIHFAAFKAVGESVREPLKYYGNNIRSFLNVLEAAKEYGSGVIFSSSATVYGNATALPVTEDTPRQPSPSPYGQTKQMCEDILQATARASDGMAGISLRYFNPVGAHPSALLGELPNGVPNNLVPYITQTAIGKRECLSIFGDDYDTPDGTCLRDYIDIVDLARAHVAAAARMLGNRMKDRYEVFNVGTGRPVSVLELVKAFEQANGVKVPYRMAPRREGDVPAVWADPSLAQHELNWKAERSIEDTMKAAWEWEKHIANSR